jgi:hypothetical protein
MVKECGTKIKAHQSPLKIILVVQDSDRYGFNVSLSFLKETQPQTAEISKNITSFLSFPST